MEFKDLIKSRNLRLLVGGLGGASVLIVVFCSGIVVGLEKARFSCRLGEKYFQAFAGPPNFFIDRSFMGGHGMAAEVIKISGENITVKTPDNAEKIVEITNQTSIKKGRVDAELKDLKAGDKILVIGSPGPEGETEAALIRIMTPPPGNP